MTFYLIDERKNGAVTHRNISDPDAIQPVGELHVYENREEFESHLDTIEVE